MNYSDLENGAFFSCTGKSTYTEIYIYAKNQYIKVFSIQKLDYKDIIGYGEKQATDVNGLIPITLTQETIDFIFKKYYGIGLLLDTTQIKDVNINQYNPSNQPTILDNPAKPVEPEVEITDTIYEPILLIDDVPVVFVKKNAIVCEVVPDEEVEVEDVEMLNPDININIEDVPSSSIIKEEKNYKWLWIAAAAAALLA